MTQSSHAPDMMMQCSPAQNLMTRKNMQISSDIMDGISGADLFDIAEEQVVVLVKETVHTVRDVTSVVT